MMSCFVMFYLIGIMLVKCLIKIELDYYVDWYNAELYCNNVFGTHLISIHSSNQNNISYEFCVCLYISFLISYQMEYIQAESTGKCWIGIYNIIALNNTFNWSDGSVNDYDNWRSNEPNNGYGTNREYCGWYGYGKYVWDDVPCNDSLTPDISTLLCQCMYIYCILKANIKYIDIFCEMYNSTQDNKIYFYECG